MEGHLIKQEMRDYMENHDIGPVQLAKRLGIEPVQSFHYWFNNEKKNLTLDIVDAFEKLKAKEWDDEDE